MKDVKVVMGTLTDSGKPSTEVFVGREIIEHLEAIPHPYEWLSFYFPGSVRVITVGKIRQVNQLWEAKLKGLWV